MLTTEQVEEALGRAELQARYPASELRWLVNRANEELRTWGHAGHQITTEHVAPFYGDPLKLHWTFWCETCHVTQLALLSRPVDHWQTEAARGSP